MIQITDNTKCTGCAACFNVCPCSAIKMLPDAEGFLYPVVNSEICIHCRKCEKVCPLVHEHFPKEDLERCFAAYNKTIEVRQESSSGGIFYSLASAVLDQGGVVFGAAYDKDFAVFHTCAENDQQLKLLLGSKYLQSRIGDIFQNVEKILNTDRKVLFVGSTCQIGGLKAFLHKEYTNLVCIDFICLGIPSPEVWLSYLETFFPKEKVFSVNFKEKSLGWHTFSLNITTDKQNFVKNGRQTHYFTGYFKGLYSRPSCSNCIYKGKNRVSDITISDCWGFHEIAPEMDDNKGLSSVICHTEKGMQLFEAIKPQLCWKEADIADVRKHNKNYCCSAPMGEERQEFWKTYHERGAKKAFRKYCEPEQNTFFARVKRKVKKTIKYMKKRVV